VEGKRQLVEIENEILRKAVGVSSQAAACLARRGSSFTLVGNA